MCDKIYTEILHNLLGISTLLEGQIKTAKHFNDRQQLLSPESAAAIEHLAKAQAALALAEKQLRPNPEAA